MWNYVSLSHFSFTFLPVYVDIGDHIALQYGGSEAHKKVSAERSESIVGPIGKVCLLRSLIRFYCYRFSPLQRNNLLVQHKELLTSIRRYYSNAFTDRLKQDAM